MGESSLWSFLQKDAVTKDTKTAVSADMSAVKEETGMDRLRRMFRTNEFEELTPEANIILQAGCMAMFVGAIYGGTIESRVAYMNFIENNQATVYKDHLHAKKQLQDKVTTSFGKGAFKWGWRLSLFTTSYVGLSTTISVYRGKSGIMEHVIAGATTGLLYKFTAGPRAWVVGSGLGMVLGTIAGCCTYGLLSLTGMSMDEVRYWNYQWKDSRNRKVREGLEKHLAKEQSAIVRERTDKFDRNQGITLSEIPNESEN